MQIPGCSQTELMSLSDWSKVRESAFSSALALHLGRGDQCGSAVAPRARRASSLGYCAFSAPLCPQAAPQAQVAPPPSLSLGFPQESGRKLTCFLPGPTPDVGVTGPGPAETDGGEARLAAHCPHLPQTADPPWNSHFRAPVLKNSIAKGYRLRFHFL